ncbi:S41 family peptidase [Chryseobacterium geocarposphaerae]|uniref:Peptidase S41-like protein n=1 Tax=Chryseobacterium geocarposphaerae TaxID=1416776 RepID=A0A2M9C821_9FLAO|nr:S41 family peptidase [Chryseobacterium geocarposphaerae]PJJ66932.1 peptidase S41-like protein [Chryseobacterium geocarposphaerae]
MKRIGLLSSILLCSLLFAQNDKTKILTEILDKIKENYIDEKVFKSLDSLFQSEIKSGQLSSSLNEKDFAENLTQKLRAATKDKHFFVKYLANYSPQKNINEKEQEKQNNFSNSLENFGFEKVERLKGNIGYINYKGFAELKSSKKALEAAMNFVENTNSLIIDLRENGGADNAMLVEFCSYFFDKNINLYTTYFRNSGKTVKNRIQSNVAGKKYLNKNIYILTSPKTFSAGEALAYFLQERKLAKVIGEKTGGAANPVDPYYIQNKYLLLVPDGKITSTYSGKNWEHIGIIPDKIVSQENALKTAYLLALQEIINHKAKTELSENDIRNLIIKLNQ